MIYLSQILTAGKTFQSLLIALTAIVGMLLLGPLSGQAHAFIAEGDASSWDFDYDDTGVGGSDTSPIPRVIANPKPEFEGATSFFNRVDPPLNSDLTPSEETNITRYEDSNVAGANFIQVDCLTQIATITLGAAGPVQIQINGTPNNDPCISEPGEDGGARISLFISHFQDILATRAIGPFRVEILDGDGVRVAEDGESERFEKGEDVFLNEFYVDFNNVPPGERYLVSIYDGELLVGEGLIEEIEAGKITFIKIRINAEDGDLDEITASERAIRSPCTGFGVGWMICHAVNGIYSGIRFLYEQIVVPLLTVQPLISHDADGNRTDIFRIWSNLRVIANILFIFIFLAAIIGVGTSWIFTQYELKRIIPRLFIGIILAQISWYLVAFIIDGGNYLGAGVRGLILSPVQDIPLPSFNLDIFGDFLGKLLSFGGIPLLFKSRGAARGILFLLPLVLIPIILAIAITIFVLSVRQLVLILLTVFSPIVFILWTLPNTSGVAKKWWETFWKLIVMYPIIIALIAGGELSSKLLVVGREDSKVFYIVGIVALFAPYFLIPSTFRFAGSVLVNVSSGFDGVRKGMNERLFGSTDPFSGNRGGYLGRVKDYREATKQQNLFKRTRDASKFTKEARNASGIVPGGLSARSLLRGNKKPSLKALGKYGAYHLGYGTGVFERDPLDSKAKHAGKVLLRSPKLMWRLGDVANRAAVSATTRISPVSVDRRMAKRTIDAKKFMDALTMHQYDDLAHAVFGDKNIFTGADLPEWAIIEGKEYRGDEAAQNAFLKYLIIQSHGGENWQKLFNHYATWNPYAIPVDPDNPDHRGQTSSQRGALWGHKQEFDTIEAGKNGVLKGGTFGTQRERKDGKSRSLGLKRPSYIRARGEMIWNRPDTQASAEQQWAEHAASQPGIVSRPSTGRDTRTAQEKLDYATQKKLFFEDRRQQFTENYFQENRFNFGLVKDGAIPDSLGEITHDMAYTGLQKGSMFEMMSEDSHRMQEVTTHYGTLIEDVVNRTIIDEDPSLSSAEKGRKIDELKASLKTSAGINNLDVAPNQSEKIRIFQEQNGGNTKLGYKDYIKSSPQAKAAVHKQKVEEWYGLAVGAVTDARNLAIDALESAGTSRNEHGDEDSFEAEFQSEADFIPKTIWREDELHKMPDYYEQILRVANKDRRDILAKGAKKSEFEAIAKAELARLGVTEGSVEFSRFTSKLHLNQVLNIIKNSKPGAPLEQVRENIDFVLMSNWVDENKINGL